MATRSRDRADRPSHPPLWLVEGLDIVSRKWVLLAVVTAVVIVVGAIVALVLPDVVPPAPAVGAAVGLAGLLLGLAAAVATDATDLVVRGPRHVAAAGGELVAVLPRDPSVAAAGPLAAAVLEVREPGVPLLLAFATASRDARRSSAWTDAIARSLVSEGVGVLRVDLASGRSEHPGLVEVVRDGTRLADAVTFEPGVKLAQLSAGRDHADALAALTELPGRLPRDLDIMLVSLPTAASRSVVAAATALDHVLIIVERDRTSRVDLIASLDALEAAGTHAQVVLLDTSTAMRLAPPVEVDPAAEAERRRTISSTVGTSPVVAPGSDGEPVPVPDDEPVPAPDDVPVSGPDDDLAAVPDDEAAAAPDEVPDEPADEAEAEVADELADEELPEAEPIAEDEGEPAAEVADPDVEEPIEAPEDGEDRDGLPFAGPLAAGVAGAGVAAGLAAVTPAPEDDEDDELDETSAAPAAEPETEDASEDASDDAPTDAPDDDIGADVGGAAPASAAGADAEVDTAAAPATTAPEESTEPEPTDHEVVEPGPWELAGAPEAVDELIAAGEDSPAEPVAAEPEPDAAPAADVESPDGPEPQADGGPEEELRAQDEEATPDDGGAEQRDLELLEAAAAATAMSIASAEQEPFEPVFDEDAEPHDLEDELPQPGEPLVEELIELAVEEEQATEADEAAQRPPTTEASEAAEAAEGPQQHPTTEVFEGAEGADAPEVHQDDDPTDRLAPVRVSDDPSLDPFDPADQDLLRTTAQLAILTDDLAVRGHAEAAAEAEERADPGSGDADADRDGHDGRDDRA